MERSKKWMRTSLTRWLKHSIHPQSKNPQSKPLQDGNPTELMTRNPTTQTTSQNTIKRNYHPLSPVPTADGQFRPNPIYQNIVKPTFVWGKNASVNHPFFFSITIIFIEKVFMLSSNPLPRNSNRQPKPKNYLKKYYLIRLVGNGRGYKVETFNREVLC